MCWKAAYLRKSCRLLAGHSHVPDGFHCYCINTGMHIGRFLLSEGAVRSVCAGASGREPPWCRRGGLARSLMFNDVIVECPFLLRERWDVRVAAKSAVQARNCRRRARYRSNPVREGPSGVILAPEGALSKQSRTKLPLRRQILAEAAILAEKKPHHHSVVGASSLGASDEWCARSGPLGA